MRAVLERYRFIVAVACLVLAATSVLTLAWSVGLTIALADDLAGGGWRDTILMADLLEIIDLVLIATVQVVVVIGLWELFVGELTLPDWLRVSSLGKLKTALAELIVLVIAVKFVEKLIKTKDPLDVLYYALGVSAVGLMLVGLLIGTRAIKGDDH